MMNSKRLSPFCLLLLASCGSSSQKISSPSTPQTQIEIESEEVKSQLRRVSRALAPLDQVITKFNDEASTRLTVAGDVAGLRRFTIAQVRALLDDLSRELIANPLAGGKAWSFQKEIGWVMEPSAGSKKTCSTTQVTVTGRTLADQSFEAAVAVSDCAHSSRPIVTLKGTAKADLSAKIASAALTQTISNELRMTGCRVMMSRGEGSRVQCEELGIHAEEIQIQVHSMTATTSSQGSSAFLLADLSDRNDDIGTIQVEWFTGSEPRAKWFRGRQNGAFTPN